MAARSGRIEKLMRRWMRRDVRPIVIVCPLNRRNRNGVGAWNETRRELSMPREKVQTITERKRDEMEFIPPNTDTRRDYLICIRFAMSNGLSGAETGAGGEVVKRASCCVCARPCQDCECPHIGP
jgi:hypothetical protein